jgi:hypothetical protein
MYMNIDTDASTSVATDIDTGIDTDIHIDADADTGIYNRYRCRYKAMAIAIIRIIYV